MRPDTYVYPAIFAYDENGIHVTFPDLPGCFAFGENEPAAIRQARNGLSLHLYGMERDGDEIPAPTSGSSVQVSSGETVAFVDVFMPPIRARQEGKYVKKTLTIPEWLDIQAKHHDINFSQVLQDALRAQLGML